MVPRTKNLENDLVEFIPAVTAKESVVDISSVAF